MLLSILPSLRIFSIFSCACSVLYPVPCILAPLRELWPFLFHRFLYTFRSRAFRICSFSSIVRRQSVWPTQPSSARGWFYHVAIIGTARDVNISKLWLKLDAETKSGNMHTCQSQKSFVSKCDLSPSRYPAHILLDSWILTFGTKGAASYTIKFITNVYLADKLLFAHFLRCDKEMWWQNGTIPCRSTAIVAGVVGNFYSVSRCRGKLYLSNPPKCSTGIENTFQQHDVIDYLPK